MTNLPTGTTETKPAPRRRLNRVITVSALAAGALAAFAAPAQAGAVTQIHGTGSSVVSGPRDCGYPPRTGGWHRADRYMSLAGPCAPTQRPYTPVSTPTYNPSPPAYNPSTPAYIPSTPVSTIEPSTTRGATISYNEGYAGSCVFYALDRFHQFTGVYPKAFGDARYLATGAAASGWATGSTPRVDSLVVFQPGQNGAGSPTGHVAWVEQVSGNQIYVSEMNAPTPYVVTYRWLTPVAGVRYVYG